MRKSACFLAILGLGVSCASAQDAFGPTAAKKDQPKPGLSIFNSKPQATAEKEPVKTAPTVPDYYDSLFNGAAPAPTQTAPVATESTVEETAAVNAVFEQAPEQSSTAIQPIKAELGDALPFPGIPAEAPTTPPIPTSTESTTAPVAPEISAVTALPQPAREVAPSPPTAPVAPEMTSTPSVVTAANLVGPQTPTVTIEWRQTSNINVGQEFDCDLVVKNSGQTIASDVEIQAHLPQNVRVVDAEPKPTQSETFLGWRFAEIAPGKEQVIRVTMLPFERGSVAAKATVRFSGATSGIFEVAEPLLAVSVKGPEEVMIGENIPQTVVVSNPGTGIASNVRIEAMIPKGLEHVRGERLLMEIGSLNPGESRNVRLAMAAVSGGEHQVLVHAVADNGLDRQTATTVNVITPVLAATVEGPKLRYLGREGSYKLVVKNDGEAATNNVQLLYKVPDGFRFVTADRGYQFNREAQMLSWFVGRLDKDQTADLNVKLVAEKAGEFKHLIRATSEHGTIADAELPCRIEGTSSLSVAVVDVDDPVELGTEAVYEIRVKNEGTAAAKNVGLACELADGMDFVSATGPADHAHESQTVVFAGAPELGPGETAIYRVHVSSKKTGNMRFRTRVTSESVSEPLTSDELTKFYGE